MFGSQTGLVRPHCISVSHTVILHRCLFFAQKGSSLNEKWKTGEQEMYKAFEVGLEQPLIFPAFAVFVFQSLKQSQICDWMTAVNQRLILFFFFFFMLKPSVL